MRYKVGDRVRIKSLDWYEKNKDEFGAVLLENGNYLFFESDTIWCGKVITIVNVCLDEYYTIAEDFGKHRWTDEMIEGVIEEPEPEPDLPLGLVLTLNGSELILHKDYEIRKDGEKFYLVKKEPMLSIKSVKKVYVCETEKARIHLEFYEDDDKACILTNLFVHSAFRHKGIGRKTVAEAEAIAKELGATKALLMVECDDWKRPWYESMGYKYHSTEDEDDVWLVKDL